MMRISLIVLYLSWALTVLTLPSYAICANSTWIACADAALSIFNAQKDEFESSPKAESDITVFYCNHTVSYYLEFAECTTTYDCWNFPSAISLRKSKYDIPECSNSIIRNILGGDDANCPITTCAELLPGSIQRTFAPRSSDSTLASTGTLAALSILAASLIF